MTTCRCCGQEIRAAATTTIMVDETLRRSCARSYQEAEYRGAHEEGVAHFVYAAARQPDLRDVFLCEQLEPERLLFEIDGFLARSRNSGRTNVLQPSDDLKTMLARAHQLVAHRQGTSVSAKDAVHTLFHHCNDLSCGQLIAHWRLSARANHVSMPSAPGKLIEINWSHVGSTQMAVERQVASPIQQQEQRLREFDVMHLRLAQQERLLTDLIGRVSLRPDGAPTEVDHRTGPDHASKHRAHLENRTAAKSAAEPRKRSRTSKKTRSVASAGGRASALRPVGTSKSVSMYTVRRRSHVGGREVLVLSRRASFDGTNTKLARAHLARINDRARAPLEDLEEVGQTSYFENDNDADEGHGRTKRFYLALDDEIVRAPSIGPKTAARLISHGIVRIKDLLAADVAELAARIGGRTMSRQRLTDWQDQSRLVCSVPWLRGTHAQMLVGAGYNTVKKILTDDAGAVCAAILRFALTRDGQSILRSGPAPEPERIFRWIAHAELAELERAA